MSKSESETRFPPGARAVQDDALQARAIDLAEGGAEPRQNRIVRNGLVHALFLPRLRIGGKERRIVSRKDAYAIAP